MLAFRLVLVIAVAIILVHGEDVETPVAPQQDAISVRPMTNDRHHLEKDDIARDNRYGRMALHAEAPSSKAKREQALRNILAARRRQLLGTKFSDTPRRASPKTSRSVLGVSKDPLDMLETQETRHGVYVTAPIGDQVSVIMDNDEEDALEVFSKENFGISTSATPGKIDKIPENVGNTTKTSLLIKINETNPWTLAESKTNKTAVSKNTSQALPRFQKILENENRRKNTVVMPDSVYNHFRPVESNIPVEDMSQFLYFGQKLHPDGQNSSSRNNNSLADATSTSSSVSSLRRRYSMKRFSTTTPVAVPLLEDIMNEEMNIALERSTIERNKIPKTKNVFRSPGSGTYFRKSSIRPSDSTIVTNVILTRESPSNSSVLSDKTRESVLLRNSGKFSGDSSAHAHLDRMAIVSDRGSNARPDSIIVAASAHRVVNVTTENYSTQFHADMARRDERRHQRRENLTPIPNDDIRLNSTNNNKIISEQFPMSQSTDESVSQLSIERDNSNAGMASTFRNELINRITTWQSVQSNHESTTFSANIEPDRNFSLTSSTINDLTGPSNMKIIPTTTTNLVSSSLRIVVTEPQGYTASIERFASRKTEEKEAREREHREEEEVEEEEEDEENENKYQGEARVTVDRVYSKKNQTIDRHVDYEPSLEYSKISVFTATFRPRVIGSDSLPQSPLLLSSSLPVTTKQQHQNPLILPVIGAESSKTEKTDNKQQHAYAYEITNLTRLLRNYTGPGLNIEVEQQVKEDRRKKDSGQAEQVEKEEEKRKNTSNKKEKKLEDERGEEKERDEMAREGERGKEVERGSALTRTSAASIPEIRDVGESVQPTPQTQPLPLLLPTPRREASSGSGNRGGKVEPARTTGQFSAGTDVGEVTASSSVDDGVGDRGGSGRGIGTRNTSSSTFPTFTTSEVGRASSVGLVDPITSTTSLPKTLGPIVPEEITESTIVTSTLRWNHTGNSRLYGSVDRPEIFGNERRYLRKSASAVLNQRTIEEGPLKEAKRRRGSSSLFSLSSNNRRIKGSRYGANDEDTRTLVSRSMENHTTLPDNDNALSEGTKKLTEMNVSMTETQTEVSINQTVGMEKISEAGTTIVPPNTLDSPLKKPIDSSTPDAAKIDSSMTNETTSKNFSWVLSSESTLSTVEVGKFVDTTTTTSAPPGFPVTPRMLGEPSETTISDKVKSADEIKSEASRPFGLAKDLDPSEIQKMYRSQTTLRPELFATTTISELERSTDENPGLTAEEEPRTISAENSSITRSPEVKGRNLSDKSKDKDDILPIMQLYNTSNIFNGTGKHSPSSVNTVRTTLPLSDTSETGHDLERTTTTMMTTTTTTTTTHDLEIVQRPKNERKDESSTDGSEFQKKNNRHGVDRDYTNSYAIPAKSSNITSHENSYNSAQSNRTKQRPSYHQTPPPEFLGYRPEFNSSFFEPGMISLSPRESINISEVITKRHDGDTIATQETVAVVSYILATLVVFPIAVGVGLILRRLIIRNRKVLEESDTSSEISCRKDALNLENGDFKTSIEKAITKLPRIQHLCHEAEKPPPPPSQESRWEFPRDKLRLQTVLGQGNFGQVWKAEADDLTGHQGTTRLVAVKTVKEGASEKEKEDLVRELEIMQQLGNHPNVVTLLGCCTEEEPHYLILEYVMYGKLLAYLRDHRTRQDFYNFSEDSAALTSRDLTVFGYCVARGMEYLASKKIIHRDLAARNVLVDHNKLCKIADFGMSRFSNDDGEVIEARHGRNALPIRWMAPESLIYSLFTTKTDVWSFGILMWEIVTLGSTPYPDMAAREVMRNVQNGYRLERPSHCRSELFRVISRCWHADPDRRPEFPILRRDMAQLLEDSMNGHYVDLESFASECTD